MYHSFLIHSSELKFLKVCKPTEPTFLRNVQFSHLVMSDSLQPHGQQHTRLPCPSPTPRACSSLRPSSGAIQPSHFIGDDIQPSHPLSFPSFPASGSFPISRFFAWGGHRNGVSALASVLSMSIQDWFPLGCTGLISLQSKGLSRSFLIPQSKSINSSVLNFLYESPTLTNF